MAARPKSPRPKKSEPTFEERLQALEAVVQALEGDDLSLEASIERYREGVAHLGACRALLDDAEKRLVALVQGTEGDLPEERPLRVTDRGLEADPSAEQ
ncbi:MAG: exodeoxyribonuclease VII small subunit [Planctomycetota bacterium]|jgi:exodeoxyribonuclease VII small subunit